MSAHRISAGAIIEQGGRFLMVRHVLPGRYDFWVAPGGGVEPHETLEAAAAREVLEETGLRATIGPLRYIEDLESPEGRCIKFWFSATVAAGEPSTRHPEARAEHIVQAAWLEQATMAGQMVFPSLLLERYAQDQAAGFPAVVRLPLRPMTAW